MFALGWSRESKFFRSPFNCLWLPIFSSRESSGSERQQWGIFPVLSLAIHAQHHQLFLDPLCFLNQALYSAYDRISQSSVFRSLADWGLVFRANGMFFYVYFVCRTFYFVRYIFEAMFVLRLAFTSQCCCNINTRESFGTFLVLFHRERQRERGLVGSHTCVPQTTPNKIKGNLLFAVFPVDSVGVCTHEKLLSHVTRCRTMFSD